MPKNSLVDIKKLHLVLKSKSYQYNSVRDLFIQSIKNPIDQILKGQERVSVLNDIDLVINHGDRIGLIGRNGAGKSSLCRCISGLLKPTRGSLKMNGSVRGIFEATVGIYPELSGLENAEILVDLIYPQLSKNKKEIVNEIVKFSDLGDFIHKPFKIYSNGMQTRLCLSIVTSQPVDLLILDEVFDGADQFFREKMHQRMMNLASQAKAVIFVSHQEDQIRSFCNRVVVLDKGNVVYDGEVGAGLQFYSERHSK